MKEEEGMYEDREGVRDGEREGGREGGRGGSEEGSLTMDIVTLLQREAGIKALLPPSLSSSHFSSLTRGGGGHKGERKRGWKGGRQRGWINS